MKVTTKSAAERFALNALLGKFTDRMGARLVEKIKQGAHGWDDPMDGYDYEGRAIAAIKEGRYVDAANIAMFMWNRQG